MATHEIRIDPGKTLIDEPGTGHNRWHPDKIGRASCRERV